MPSIFRQLVNAPVRAFQYFFLSNRNLAIPGSDVTFLNWSTNINDNFRHLKLRAWSRSEIVHYSFLVLVILFVAIILPIPIMNKLAILTLFSLAFLMPITSQFFVSALPVFAWLALYFSAGKIPTSWKPPISVKVLPAVETILYGDDLSNVLAATTNTVLDIIAWIPYGVVHFSAPFIVAAMVFLFGPPTLLRLFGFAFGYMNLFGVMIQLTFPAASPWYKNLYGLEPANYGMHGSPGGLGRIDALFGADMYTTAFSTSPVIFGAFPSLHAGCSVMDVLWLCWLFPKLRVLWWSYALWLWWSTMYLTHHYFVDLIGGAVLLFAVFEYTKYTHLPKINYAKFCRWSYTLIAKFNISAADPLSNNYVDGEGAEYSPTLQVPVQAPFAMRVSPYEDVELSTFRQPTSMGSHASYLTPSTEVESDDMSASETDAPLVFDTQLQVSSATSTTSVDEVDPAQTERAKRFKGC